MSYFDMMIDIIEEEPFKYEIVAIVILYAVTISAGFICKLFVPHITL
jgi:hypothetical protein